MLRLETMFCRRFCLKKSSVQHFPCSYGLLDSVCRRARLEISEAAIAFVFPVVFPPSLDICGCHDPPLSFAGRPTIVFFSAQCQAMAHATILIEKLPIPPETDCLGLRLVCKGVL